VDEQAMNERYDTADHRVWSAAKALAPASSRCARYLRGSSHHHKPVASSVPTICAPINGTTPPGAMPAKVSLRERATVTAGLANDVEAVNQ
jgi:hypothetical protein